VLLAFTVNTGGLGNPRLGEGQVWSHDTHDNVLAMGEFVMNVVPFEAAVIQKAFICGLPFRPGVNELEKASLVPLPATSVKPPRVAECHAHFECKLQWTRALPHRDIVVGRVAAVSVDEGCLDERGWPLLDRVKPAQFVQGKLIPAYQVTSVPWNYAGSRDELVDGFEGPFHGPTSGPSDSTSVGRPSP
jgi:flavin reductase (DIM6/NTAB) family NADH-FMN oxidoreductase RutF